MKPYQYATIALAGFVMVAGTASIVTAEYQIASKGTAVADMFGKRNSIVAGPAPIVADRFDMSRLDADPYGNDLPARLNSVIDANQYLPAPDVNLSVEPTCPKEPAKVAQIVMAPHAKHTTHALPIAPEVVFAPKAMPATYSWTVPSQANWKSKDLPKALKTFFKQDGKTHTFVFTGPKGQESMRFVFDSKKFMADQKVMAEQMKNQNWANLSADEAKFQKYGALIQLRGMSDHNPALGVIRIDPEASDAIAAAAQKVAEKNVEAAMHGADIELQNAMQVDGTAKN